MMVLMVLFIIVSAFLFGFILGNLPAPSVKIKRNNIVDDEDIKRLKKEYENFLNYDGTEQT